MTDSIMNKVIRVSKFYDMTSDVNEKAYVLGSLSLFMSLFPDNFKIRLINDRFAIKSIPIHGQIKYNYLIEQHEREMFIEKISTFIKDNIILDYKKRKNINYYPSLKPSEIDKMLEDFFKGISPELYDFYLNLKAKDNIITCEDWKDDGAAFLLLPNDSETIIVIKKLVTVLDVSILVHEIGHAYYNYVNNANLQFISDVENGIKSEIPARLLELLFTNYLSNNYSSHCAKCLKNYYHNWLALEDYQMHNYTHLIYFLGNYLSFKMFDYYSDFSGIEECFKYIGDTTIEDLILGKKVHSLRK